MRKILEMWWHMGLSFQVEYKTASKVDVIAVGRIRKMG